MELSHDYSGRKGLNSNDNIENYAKSFLDIFYLTGVPVILFNKSGIVIDYLGEGLDKLYSQDYLQSVSHSIEKSEYSESVHIYNWGQNYNVGLAKLGEWFIITPPICTVLHNEKILFSDNVQHLIMKGKELFRLLSGLPIMGTYQLAMVLKVLKKLMQLNMPADIGIQYIDSSAETKALLRENPLESLVTVDKHASMQYEEAIKDAVRDGDENRLINVYRRSMIGTIGRMSQNHLTQEKYAFVIFASFVSRAAIEGGLSEENSFNMSDSYCQQMDMMRKPEDVYKLRLKMAVEYCRLVRKIKGKKVYSSYTRTCCNYIMYHLYDVLKVDDIARTVGLNRRSLEKYFRQDTGMGIAEYIVDCRLEEADYLIRNTTMTIRDISILLQFSDQSHFGRRYKKKYGMTPGEVKAQ